MADPNASSSVAPGAAKRGFLKNFVIGQAPYIILLILALVGVALSDLSPARSLIYWQVVVPVFAVLCIIARWSRTGSEQRNRLRLIWTQALHWSAVLVVMRLLFVHDVQQLLDSEITGVMLIYLLALSTFLAGIYLDWRLGVVGVFLVVSALAIAFLDEVALPMIALGIIVVLAFALWNRFRAPHEQQ